MFVTFKVTKKNLKYKSTVYLLIRNTAAAAMIRATVHALTTAANIVI